MFSTAEGHLVCCYKFKLQTKVIGDMTSSVGGQHKTFLMFSRVTEAPPILPGAPLSVLPVSRLPAPVPDVVAIYGHQFLPALGRLLLLPEAVVFPAALVLPQLPVTTFRSGVGNAKCKKTHKDTQSALIISDERGSGHSRCTSSGQSHPGPTSLPPGRVP